MTADSNKYDEFEYRIRSLEKDIVHLKSHIKETNPFDKHKWSGDLKDLDSNKIYAYHEPHGGIYKTMTLSLIGNEDFVLEKFEGNDYYGFVRIDNVCGYCQFMYKSIVELFEKHNTSLHNRYQIYEFKDTKTFLEWCLSFDKIY